MSALWSWRPHAEPFIDRPYRYPSLSALPIGRGRLRPPALTWRVVAYLPRLASEWHESGRCFTFFTGPLPTQVPHLIASNCELALQPWRRVHRTYCAAYRIMDLLILREQIADETAMS